MADGVRVRVRGDEAVAIRLGIIGREIQRDSRALTRQYGVIYMQRVQAGAPVRTGGYRSRIRMRMAGGGSHSYAYVSSPDPFAMRLENGFTGQDSLGRTYSQSPQSHWRPPLIPTRREFKRALQLMIRAKDKL